MDYLSLIGTVTILHLLALMSPGPDFLMILRNALTYSRRIGVWTAIGLCFGIMVHLLYCFAGIALLISKSIVIFNIIKLLGAGYLIYMGIGSLLQKSEKIDLYTIKKKKEIMPFTAIKIGFFTNILNPKATLFFLSLFTLVISPETPNHILLILSVIMVLLTGIWFSFVAIFFTYPKVQRIFSKYQNCFNKVFGGLLVSLGLKVAFTRL